MNIRLTEFARNRHFDPNRPGTMITDRLPAQFEMELNKEVQSDRARWDAGYAPFCKLLFLENWTDAAVGTMEITPENRERLRSEYQARTEGELPVLSRWFEGHMTFPPQADFLCIVLYSADQIRKEGSEAWEGDAWGVVAILGQSHSEEEPMTPITMMRNALGADEGGSGVPLDREAYQRSVEFWQTHAVVKGG